MTTVVVRGLMAMAVTLAVGPVVLAALRRKRVLDHPSPRSSHVAPVPRGGGIAPAVGALLALALTPDLSGSSRWQLAVAAVLFGVLGLVEDLVGVPALYRLGLQFAGAGALALSLADDLTGPILWRGGCAIAVALWLAAFVNAFNFMDGIDGISIAQAVAAGATWLVVGAWADSPVLAAGGAIAAGAALGFAPFNLPRARMFLGDVGSYFLGAWLAAVAVLGLRAGVPPEAVLAPLVLYVADTGVTLIRRVIRGERWYLPHRDHVYQRLSHGGWSHVRTSSLVAACIAACGALGAASLGHSLPARLAADVAIAAVIVGYLLAPRWVGRRSGTASVPLPSGS